MRALQYTLQKIAELASPTPSSAGSDFPLAARSLRGGASRTSIEIMIEIAPLFSSHVRRERSGGVALGSPPPLRLKGSGSPHPSYEPLSRPVGRAVGCGWQLVLRGATLSGGGAISHRPPGAWSGATGSSCAGIASARAARTTATPAPAGGPRPSLRFGPWPRPPMPGQELGGESR